MNKAHKKHFRFLTSIIKASRNYKHYHNNRYFFSLFRRFFFGFLCSRLLKVVLILITDDNKKTPLKFILENSYKREKKSSLIFQETLQPHFCYSKHETVLVIKSSAFKQITMSLPWTPALVGLGTESSRLSEKKSFKACELEKLIKFLSHFDNLSMNGAFVELIYNNLFIFLLSLPLWYRFLNQGPVHVTTTLERCLRPPWIS